MVYGYTDESQILRVIWVIFPSIVIPSIFPSIHLMNLSETLAMNLPFPLPYISAAPPGPRASGQRTRPWHQAWSDLSPGLGNPLRVSLGETSDRNGCYPSNPVVFHQTMGNLKLFSQDFQWKMDENGPLSCRFRCCLGVFLVFLCFLRFGCM